MSKKQQPMTNTPQQPGAEREGLEHIDKFIADYFAGYEWVGSGRSAINGAEWRIVLDIPALRKRLMTLSALSSKEGK